MHSGQSNIEKMGNYFFLLSHPHIPLSTGDTFQSQRHTSRVPGRAAGREPAVVSKRNDA